MCDTKLFNGRNIVLGVSGGIAAYKAVEVVSRLKKLGAEVDVIMTGNAMKFVAPLTFGTISRRPVTTGMFNENFQWDVKHISLARKADIIVVVPATANIIGKIANGIADDMLSTTIMAAKCNTIFVPAMNTKMYTNAIVQKNIKTLKENGYLLMEPSEGILACGEMGTGRAPEPVEVVEKVKKEIFKGNDLKGHNILITAGPTREFLDPVRFLSNPSSGKMGYALASEASQRGARVKLVSGPVSIEPPSGVEIAGVISAEDMYNEVMKSHSEFDIIILVAAVADYRPVCTEKHKIKKGNADINIKMKKNPDIALELGKIKGSRIIVGACAETENLYENARNKLDKKNFDMIIANDVTLEGAGFETDTNIVRLVKKDGIYKDLPKMHKKGVARHIIDEILEMKAL